MAAVWTAWTTSKPSSPAKISTGTPRGAGLFFQASTRSIRREMVLIEQRDDKPSMYREFLAAGHEGLQHWSSWPENYHELLDRR